MEGAVFMQVSMVFGNKAPILLVGSCMTVCNITVTYVKYIS